MRSPPHLSVGKLSDPRTSHPRLESLELILLCGLKWALYYVEALAPDSDFTLMPDCPVGISKPVSRAMYLTLPHPVIQTHILEPSWAPPNLVTCHRR